MWVKTYYCKSKNGIREEQFTRFQKTMAQGAGGDIWNDNVPEPMPIKLAQKLIQEWNRISRQMKADYLYSLNKPE